MIPAIEKFYRDNEKLQRDKAIRGIGMASQTLILAAKPAGYDSCPMIGFDLENVAESINLPNDHFIDLMLVIGKTKRPSNPREGQLNLDQA